MRQAVYLTSNPRMSGEKGGIVMKPAEERLAADNVVAALQSIMAVVNPLLVGHQQRVAKLAFALAVELKMAADVAEGIRIAGLLHDIGEIGIPISILSKPAKLNADEFVLIKAHPQTGYDILKAVGFAQPVAEIVLQHHERLDGSGYPHRLSGGAILPQARILGAADVVEAMASHRMYRTALGVEAALAELSEHAGKRYDAEAVGACLTLFTRKNFRFP